MVERDRTRPTWFRISSQGKRGVDALLKIGDSNGLSVGRPRRPDANMLANSDTSNKSPSAYDLEAA